MQDLENERKYSGMTQEKQVVLTKKISAGFPMEIFLLSYSNT